MLISLDSFMHQRHSFRPINVTRDILQALASHLDMGPALLDVLSNFYQKVTDLEETYCAPLATWETTQYFGIRLATSGA
jgi:hypothetical protein